MYIFLPLFNRDRTLFTHGGGSKPPPYAFFKAPATLVISISNF